jgi:hypothetical protein
VVACGEYDLSASPHTLLSVGPHELTRPPASQGIPPPQTQPLSLETGATSLGFLTSSTYSDLWEFSCYPAELGYGGNPLYPRGVARVAANPHPFFVLLSGPRPAPKHRRPRKPFR